MSYKRSAGATIFSVIVLVLFFVMFAVLLFPVYKARDVERSRHTGYLEEQSLNEVQVQGSQEPAEINEESGTKVRISVDSANIRTGAGTENEVITVVNNGQEFYTTGNVVPAANGSLWYEVYLDDGMQTTGWASEKVIELIEQ